jgi:hypothetical protein
MKWYHLKYKITSVCMCVDRQLFWQEMVAEESRGDWNTDTTSLEQRLENLVCFLLCCNMVGTSRMLALHIYFFCYNLYTHFSWCRRSMCTKVLKSRLMIYLSEDKRPIFYLHAKIKPSVDQ